MKKKNCVFCDRSNIKGRIVDYDGCFGFVPLNPVCKGHILLVPNKHVSDFADEPEISAQVMKVAGQLVHDWGGDWNIITSKGREATQSVFHLHIHLVPRRKNDGLKLPWSE